MRQLVTPNTALDLHKTVDIYEKGADPDVDEPLAAGYKATSIVHENGRRYQHHHDGSYFSRHDKDVELYLAGR